MSNILLIAGNITNDGAYVEIITKAGHKVTCVEAADSGACNKIAETIKSGDFDLIVLKNLRSLLESDQATSAKHLMTNIANTNRPVIVFDRFAGNMAHRLGFTQLWPENVRIEEACTQTKENGRRLTTALREVLSSASARTQPSRHLQP